LPKAVFELSGVGLCGTSDQVSDFLTMAWKEFEHFGRGQNQTILNICRAQNNLVTQLCLADELLMMERDPIGTAAFRRNKHCFGR